MQQTSLKGEGSKSAASRGYVFIVADGMGGHVAGEVASALSLVSIEAFLLNSLKRFSTLKCNEESTVLKEFEAAVRQADARLFEEASQHPELLGMGTTLTIAFAVRRCLFIARPNDFSVKNPDTQAMIASVIYNPTLTVLLIEWLCR